MSPPFHDEAKAGDEQGLDADSTTDAEAAADADDPLQDGETWSGTEEHQKKSPPVGTVTLADPNAQFPSLMKPVTRLPAGPSQGQKEAPEIITPNAEALGGGGAQTLRRTVKWHCPPRARTGRGGRWPVAGGGRNLKVVHRELSSHHSIF